MRTPASRKALTMVCVEAPPGWAVAGQPATAGFLLPPLHLRGIRPSLMATGCGGVRLHRAWFIYPLAAQTAVSIESNI